MESKWIFQQNGNIKINVGAAGLEAVKLGLTENIHEHDQEHYHDNTNPETRNGMLLDKNIIGIFHQHIYNFRLDMDVDDRNNSVLELDPTVSPVANNPVRKSEMILNEKIYQTEQEAKQKFDPEKVILVTNQAWTEQNRNIAKTDDVVWVTTGTTPYPSGRGMANDVYGVGIRHA